MKHYVLTYVGLSDSDYEANGYSEVYLFDTLEDAQSKLREIAVNELDYHESEGSKCEVLEAFDNEFRMSWDGDGEQIRLQIHEV